MIAFEGAMEARRGIVERSEGEVSFTKPRKKPMSAFFEFARTRRGILRNQNKRATNSVVSRMLSDEWHSLPEYRRKVFTDLYETKMAKYKEDIKPFRELKKRSRRKAATSLPMQQPMATIAIPSYQPNRIPSLPASHKMLLSGSLGVDTRPQYPSVPTTYSQLGASPNSTALVGLSPSNPCTLHLSEQEEETPSEKDPHQRNTV